MTKLRIVAMDFISGRCLVNRAVVLSVLIVCGALSIALSGYQASNPPLVQPPPRIDHVRNNLYVIRTDPGAGNSGVFITDKGVVLVDTKYATNGQMILDMIKLVTNKPVIMIINTHTHGDHTGANAEFPGTIDFVAQENTKANMEKMDAFKGDKAQFLPKKTFKDKMSLLSGKDQIDLYYFGRGHTNGDAWIVYPAVRTLQTGDMFSRKATPIIDVRNGGSGVEFSKTLANAVATIKNVDTVVPGHSVVMHWSDLKEYTDFHVGFLKTVQEAMKAGKSVDDLVNTYPWPEAVAAPNVESNRFGTPAFRKDYVQAIYNELKK